MEQLNIHPRIISAIKNAKLTNYVTLLSMSAPDIERATGLSAADVSILHRAVAEAITMTPCTTGLKLQKEPVEKLSTGCPVLDAFLQGGLLPTGITEVSGESATGKTQIGMQLCLTVQLPTRLGGLGSGALYICTEDAFPNKRLHQMAHHFRTAHDEPEVKKLAIMDNIFIEHAADLEDLRFCIMQKAPVLLNRGAARLLIIDSIAALFRCDFGVSESARRAKEISTLGMQLHRLSHKFNVPVICINQVTASMSRTDGCTGSTDSQVKPALGLTWANLVTTRLMLSRVPGRAFRSRALKSDGTQDETLLPVRKMEVVFAPHLPKSACEYVVHAGGVSGLS